MKEIHTHTHIYISCIHKFKIKEINKKSPIYFELCAYREFILLKNLREEKNMNFEDIGKARKIYYRTQVI